MFEAEAQLGTLKILKIRKRLAIVFQLKLSKILFKDGGNFSKWQPSVFKLLLKICENVTKEFSASEKNSQNEIS
jgi:hypothetical protein